MCEIIIIIISFFFLFLSNTCCIYNFRYLLYDQLHHFRWQMRIDQRKARNSKKRHTTYNEHHTPAIQSIVYTILLPISSIQMKRLLLFHLHVPISRFKCESWGVRTSAYFIIFRLPWCQSTWECHEFLAKSFFISLFRCVCVCVFVSAGCCFFIHFIFPPSTTNFMATTNNEQTIIIVELIGATTL